MSTKKHGGKRSGAGRPKLSLDDAQRLTRRSIAMYPSQWSYLRRKADEHGVSVDRFLRELVVECNFKCIDPLQGIKNP